MSGLASLLPPLLVYSPLFRTVPAGKIIVRQGGSGFSLFLVARGVIRVSRQDGGVSRDLATRIAG